MGTIWVLVIYTILPDATIVGETPWRHFDAFDSCMVHVSQMHAKRVNPNLYPACVKAQELKNGA